MPSALHHIFIPLLMGFMGMYCFRELLPLNLIIASSIATSLCGTYWNRKFARIDSRNGRTLNSLSKPGIPLTGIFELSFTCKYRVIVSKRATVIIRANDGTVLGPTVTNTVNRVHRHGNTKTEICQQFSVSNSLK